MNKYRCTRLCAFSVGLMAAMLGSVPMQAQDANDRVSYTVSLNQDVFFGFYPTFLANYKVNDKVDWTAYGIIWTTPSFGTGGGGGLWTEVGTGVSLKALEGKLTVTPQIGFLNGKLLSNGSYPNALEGIVPNLTANLNTNRVESELYAGFYTAIRKGKVAGPTPNTLVDASVQNNFTHWWWNGGVKASSMMSLGLHFEHLHFRPSGSGSSAVSSSSLYRWLGPYIQANFSPKFSVRFTTGADILDRPAGNGNNSFYKLTATYRFP